MSNDTLDLDALEAAIYGMTDAPWHWGHHETLTPSGKPESMRTVYGPSGRALLWLDVDTLAVTSGADTDGIIALRNAAPALIARARESATKDARIAALTAALGEALDVMATTTDMLAEYGEFEDDLPDERDRVARLRALLGTEGA
jgi:hypothetical protein